MKHPTDSESASRKGQLERELAFVFGPDVLERSKQISADRMCAMAPEVAKGARRLISKNGKPEVQRALVKKMPGHVATALCKWIFDQAAVGKIMNEIRQ